MKTFQEIYDHLPPDGWLSEPEASLMWKYLIDTHSSLSILEVGCYQGRSTCLLASLGHQLYCVDPFEGFHTDLTAHQIYHRFVENLCERGIYKVILSKGMIENWEPPPGKKFGLAYLDGEHTYVGTVAQIQKSLLIDAHVVMIHDVNDTGGGAKVKEAALDLLGPWDERVERLAVWRRR